MSTLTEDLVDFTVATASDALAIAANLEEQLRKCRERKPSGSGASPSGPRGDGPRGAEVGGQHTWLDIWFLFNTVTTSFAGQRFADLTNEQNRRVNQCIDRFTRELLMTARQAPGRARDVDYGRHQAGRPQSRPQVDEAEVERQREAVRRRMREIRRQMKRCVESAAGK